MTNLAPLSSNGLAKRRSIFDDSLWDAFFSVPLSSTMRYQENSLRVRDPRKEGDYLITQVEVPGIDPSEINVKVDGRTLHVTTPEGNSYVSLPGRLDTDNTEATIRHGLLTVRIPLREGRSVEVKLLEE